MGLLDGVGKDSMKIAVDEAAVKLDPIVRETINHAATHVNEILDRLKADIGRALVAAGQSLLEIRTETYSQIHIQEVKR